MRVMYQHQIPTDSIIEVILRERSPRRDVAARVYPCVNAMVGRDCETQVIVPHGFTLSLVIAAWMKVPVDACGFISYAAPSGSITHLRQDDFFRSRAMIRFADTSPLVR
ncbi:Histidine phosphatase superfamily (branch 1) [Rhizobium sp. NFACC06-2]|nr:Histidine phosphatase superfamily (branch 1) [Rhizobium sp. NFACC06-2]